jgi:hypothetical protein
MATEIYEEDTVELVDGTVIELKPLKIKYLREFMNVFDLLEYSKTDDQAIRVLAECARVCMKQFFPSIKTIEDLEDSVSMPAVYKILEIAAGIKINNPEKEIKKQATESGSTWKTLDLAKLESEVFLIGIWKDYEELELSLSMPELVLTLGAKRDLDYEEKKFLAAIQGVDLDKQSGKNNSNAWEEMKARVFSGGATSDPNDILSFQGTKASQNGFGIGMGLKYEKIN